MTDQHGDGAGFEADADECRFRFGEDRDDDDDDVSIGHLLDAAATGAGMAAGARFAKTTLGDALANSGVELYASECCGGLFVPGSGPDDIHEAVANDALVIEKRPDVDGSAVRGQVNHHDRTRWHRVYVVPETVADVHDAVRAGECPNCGELHPAMDLIK